MADAKISALTDGGGLAAGDAIAIARSGASYRASPIGHPVLVYRYTVTGSVKASIDTGVDTAAAGSNDWTNGDVLEVYILVRTDDAGAFVNLALNVNNDTNAIYDLQVLQGNNATPSATAVLAGTKWLAGVHGDGGSASYASACHLVIPDYAGTTFNKTGTLTAATSDATAANNEMQVLGYGWRSTAAITRLKIAPNSGANLKIGTQLLIYKRLAS